MGINQVDKPGKENRINVDKGDNTGDKTESPTEKGEIVHGMGMRNREIHQILLRTENRETLESGGFSKGLEKLSTELYTILWTMWITQNPRSLSFSVIKEFDILCLNAESVMNRRKRVIMISLLAIALLPCAFLMYKIYEADKIEKEPTGLLIKLLFLGCLSTIPAMILEMVWTNLLTGIGMDPNSVLFILIENFLVVAVAEEGSKKVLLRLGSWNDPAFNYVFDGVVYAVCVSLGFAGLENVLYISGFGMDVALIRGLAAVPLHCICGVFMGHLYGLEKTYTVRGMVNEAKNAKLMSMLIPVLIHGFYDFAASMGSEMFLYLWLIFVVVIDIVAIRSIKKYSSYDTPI